MIATLFAFSLALAHEKAELKTVAQKMVNGAKVVKEDGKEFDLQTERGTIVEVELNADGTVDEASGNSALGGDAFAPGGGLLSLNQAAEALKKAGKTASGDWSFDKSMRHGWVYEFEGIENGKSMEYGVSAKDGTLVKDRRDIL